MKDIVRNCLEAGMNDYIRFSLCACPMCPACLACPACPACSNFTYSKPIDFPKLYASIARLLTRPTATTHTSSSSSTTASTSLSSFSLTSSTNTITSPGLPRSPSDPPDIVEPQQKKARVIVASTELLP